MTVILHNGPADGLPHYRHFEGLFNVPVQAPTLGNPFYGYSPRNRPISVAFNDAHGNTKDLFLC